MGASPRAHPTRALFVGSKSSPLGAASSPWRSRPSPGAPGLRPCSPPVKFSPEAMSNFSWPGYMNQCAGTGCKGESRKASPTRTPRTRTSSAQRAPPPTRTSSAQRAPPRPNGNRSPPLARALPAPRVLRWTLLAACGPDQARRNHARRGSHSLSPRSSVPTPAERDRDAPSAPVVLPRTAPGRVRRRPPRRGTLRRRAARLRRRAPETLFLKPCPCVARAPGDTERHCWKRAGPKPSPVTRPRPGYGVTPLLGRPSSAPPTSGATSSRCRTRSGPQRHRPPC